MKSVLVIGTGRFGRYTIETLNGLGHEVLAVDRNEEKINRVLPFVAGAEIGDSTNEDFLAELGVDEFDLTIVAIGDDFLSSLETASLLKDMGARRVIARATSESQEKLLLRCGADEVVFPERQLGRWAAIRFSADNISEYIELENDYIILKVPVPAAWDGKSVGELNVRSAYGINILGVEHGEMNMEISSHTMLYADAHVLVLGKFEQLKQLFMD